MTAPSITRINPPELGTPPGYSQIVDVRAGRIIFIAGQTALDQRRPIWSARPILPRRPRRCSATSHMALQSRGCTASQPGRN